MDESQQCCVFASFTAAYVNAQLLFTPPSSPCPHSDCDSRDGDVFLLPKYLACSLVGQVQTETCSLHERHKGQLGPTVPPSPSTAAMEAGLWSGGTDGGREKAGLEDRSQTL